MNPRFSFRSILRSVIASILLVAVPCCQAQPSTAHLSRHAKKMQRALAACPVGSHVHLTMSDHSDQFGDLGKVTESSFELLDTSTHSPQTLSYEKVSQVDCENRIKTAGLSFHSHHGATGFLILIGIAVGVSVGILATSSN